jgi:hypothetical protein
MVSVHKSISALRLTPEMLIYESKLRFPVPSQALILNFMNRTHHLIDRH